MLNQKVYVDETGLSFFRDKAIITEIVSDTDLTNGVGYILATGKAKANVTYYERSGLGTTAEPYTFTEKTGLTVGTSYVGNYYVKITSSNINNTTSAPSIYGVVDYTNKAISSVQDTLNDKIDNVEESLASSITTEIGNINETLKNKVDSDTLEGYLPLTGGTLTGSVTAPSFQTGTSESAYFQTKKMRGQGDASDYRHSVDWGYSGHDQVDFYEYGGKWNFYQNQSQTNTNRKLVGSILSTGWNGGAVLSGTPTAPTASKGTSTTQIATTAFVQTALEDTYTQTVIDNKISAINDALGTKANSEDLATVATTGDYSDLINKPTLGALASKDSLTANDIPTITKSKISDFPTLATVATTGDYSDLTGTPDLGSLAYKSALNSSDIPDIGMSQVTGLSDALNTKANQATTLAGYSIGDAYTKTEIDTKLVSSMKYMGQKDTPDDLPDTGNNTGEVWDVKSNGHNYAWNGTSWDDLGDNSIDLSSYYTKDSINDLLNKKSDTTHTHNYAGSTTSGGSANSAVMLTSGTVGSTTEPVYFNNGAPAKCGYTITTTAPSGSTETTSIPTSSAVYAAIQSAITNAINASY